MKKTTKQNKKNSLFISPYSSPQTAVPADCLRHAHHLYYKYLLNDAQTFGNFSHIIAFAPDMASAAIRIKEDLKTSYGREVKVVLINYRTMSYDSDEQLLDCLEEQDWFSRRNISQVSVSRSRLGRLRDWSLITGRGGGLQNGRGNMKFYP